MRPSTCLELTGVLVGVCVNLTAVCYYIVSHTELRESHTEPCLNCVLFECVDLFWKKSFQNNLYRFTGTMYMIYTISFIMYIAWIMLF